MALSILSVGSGVRRVHQTVAAGRRQGSLRATAGRPLRHLQLKRGVRFGNTRGHEAAETQWRCSVAVSPAAEVEPEPDMDSQGYFEPSAANMGTQVVDPAELMSTPKQRAICAVWWALAGAMAYSALSAIADPQTAVRAAIGVVAAWVLSDAGTGIFHWSVDNYGNKQTPVLGNVIDSFQGHHKWPWTITKRQFANNVSSICVPVIPCQALILALQPPPPLMLFWAVFSLLVPLSQQFHAWSHLRKSEVPGPVRVLQDLGVLVSCKVHGAHHRPPFEGNYCIVSGLMNGPLDRSGFFALLDRTVYGLTGVAPRCWSFPPQIPEGATVWFRRR